MERVSTNVVSLEFTPFGTLQVTCQQVIDFNDLQALLASKGGNTFAVFLRGLNKDKLDTYKAAMLNKEIEIIFSDFSISELSPSHTTITWVDGDGEQHTISKIRASTANLNTTPKELRQMALDSLNARVAGGAELK